jgi:hypothetical protein
MTSTPPACELAHGREEERERDRAPPRKARGRNARLADTDRARQPDLAKTADGSVDIYAGPQAPAGFEKNWIASVPGKAWFRDFRLYAPTEVHFNRTWIPPDIEKVK